MNSPEAKPYLNGHSIVKQLVSNPIFPGDKAELTHEEKTKAIADHFREIMLILGLDLNDDSLRNTPSRVAKMYIGEIFSGLLEENEPDITLFENKYHYSEMLIEKSISVYSTCEHHFVPIIGKAHIAYMPNGKVVGLSKLNRIVHYFSKRPQVQERLTVQIAGYLKKVLHTEDVAVVIEATHLCVISRGIRDVDSSTITSSYHGQFLDAEKRKEFNRQLNHQ
ncbi:MAG: GTP cyclohydrolase I FolE [Bacteroidota bacterium]|nr:GTP cyclohydrolase I FolE [Bacteroidota bacterium]